MIIEHLDNASQQRHEDFKKTKVATAVEQAQQTNQPMPPDPLRKKVETKSYLSVDEALTFWNCMVPCGWSLGGLIAFLLNRKRRSAGQVNGLDPILSSAAFGVLSTLCYLIAMSHAWRYGNDQPLQQSKT